MPWNQHLQNKYGKAILLRIRKAHTGTNETKHFSIKGNQTVQGYMPLCPISPRTDWNISEIHTHSLKKTVQTEGKNNQYMRDFSKSSEDRTQMGVYWWTIVKEVMTWNVPWGTCVRVWGGATICQPEYQRDSGLRGKDWLGTWKQTDLLKI